MLQSNTYQSGQCPAGCSEQALPWNEGGTNIKYLLLHGLRRTHNPRAATWEWMKRVEELPTAGTASLLQEISPSSQLVPEPKNVIKLVKSAPSSPTGQGRGQPWPMCSVSPAQALLAQLHGVGPSLKLPRERGFMRCFCWLWRKEGGCSSCWSRAFGVPVLPSEGAISCPCPSGGTHGHAWLAPHGQSLLVNVALFLRKSMQLSGVGLEGANLELCPRKTSRPLPCSHFLFYGYGDNVRKFFKKSFKRYRIHGISELQQRCRLQCLETFLSCCSLFLH